MSARDEILAGLRARGSADAELPDSGGDWQRFDDPVARFTRAVREAGGTCMTCSRDELDDRIGELRGEIDARRFVSAGLDSSGASESEGGSAVDCAAIDLLVVAGEVAVAENGAVWVSDRWLAQRAALFLTQHLGLVVPTTSLVHTMHEAYAAIAVDDRPYGVFVSGPSKTADIEQCLVIGAHGPRSVRVFLVD